MPSDSRAIALAIVIGTGGCFTESRFGEADLSRSSLVVSPPSLPADGQTASVVVVTMLRANGSPVAGVNVSIEAADCILSQERTLTDASGRVTASLVSSAVGRKQVQAVASFGEFTQALPQTATVDVLTAGATTTGQPVDLLVVATTASGDVYTQFSGTVHFVSSDPLATLPPDYSFNGTDAGQVVLAGGAMLRTAGVQSISAVDIATGQTMWTQQLVVQPGPAASLGLTGPWQVTARQPAVFTVRAADAYGNLATGYRGQIAFASSDSQAQLPGTAAFDQGDQGQKDLSVAFVTVGMQSLTVTDTASPWVHGTQGGITVSATTLNKVVITDAPDSQSEP